MSSTNSTTKKILFILFIVAISAMLLLLSEQSIDLARIQTAIAEIKQWRLHNAELFAGLFFATYVLITATSLPIAVWMTLAAGALFGLWWGTLLVSFASSIGATVAFLSSRYFLRDWVTSKLGSRAQAIDAGLAKDGDFYLFSLRLIPILPFFVVNLLMGLTTMKSWCFIG